MSPVHPSYEDDTHVEPPLSMTGINSGDTGLEIDMVDSEAQSEAVTVTPIHLISRRRLAEIPNW